MGAPVMEKISLEYMPLSALKKHQRNAKLHKLDDLGDSIERFGFVNPLVIDERSGSLVAGHGRLDALLRLKEKGEAPPTRIRVTDGDWQVPVIRGVAFRDEREAEAFLVADNRLTEVGGWNDEVLNSILKDLREGASLVGTGWSDAQVDSIIRSTQTAGDMGALPEQRLVVFEAGAIKQIVLYFDGKDYEAVIERLQRVVEKTNALSHTEAFLALLKHYEDTAGK